MYIFLGYFASFLEEFYAYWCYLLSYSRFIFGCSCFMYFVAFLFFLPCIFPSMDVFWRPPQSSLLCHDHRVKKEQKYGSSADLPSFYPLCFPAAVWLRSIKVSVNRDVLQWRKGISRHLQRNPKQASRNREVWFSLV